MNIMIIKKSIVILFLMMMFKKSIAILFIMMMKDDEFMKL